MGHAKLGRGRGPFSQQNQPFGWKSIPVDLEHLAAAGAPNRLFTVYAKRYTRRLHL
jgi:hypothetical protein